MQVLEGEHAPWGYGFAWRSYSEMAVVVYPIPFNFIARWTRELYFWLAKPRRFWADQFYLDGYEKGREVADKFSEMKIKKLNEEWSRTCGLAILNERERVVITKNLWTTRKIRRGKSKT